MAPSNEESNTPAELVGSWALIAVDGNPGDMGDVTPTLDLRRDGSIGGFSGVNRFVTRLGSEDAVEGTMSLGPTAGTRMAGPPRAMAFEKIFLERLDAVTGYDVDGDTLRLWSGDDEVLTFERQA